MAWDINTKTPTLDCTFSILLEEVEQRALMPMYDFQCHKVSHGNECLQTTNIVIRHLATNHMIVQ